MMPILAAVLTNVLVGAVGGYLAGVYADDVRDAVPSLLGTLVVTVAAATVYPSLVTLAALGGSIAVSVGVVCYHYLPADTDSRTRAGNER